MARPQNSPRGLHAKTRYEMGADGIFGTPYSSNTAVLDSNSSGAILAGGITFTDAATGLPGDVEYNGLKWVVDSTGNVGIAINTTGTTWKYLLTTSAASVPT